MADIVMFPQDNSVQAVEAAPCGDTFLKDEGLDLLAAYRRIGDAATRASIMHLVRALAAAGAREGGER